MEHYGTSGFAVRITLFIPCFVDLCYPSAGISVVQILENLGHSIDYPQELACCGQPAFNSGYWDETRSVAVKVLDRLQDAEAVVVVSGSCGAMIKNYYPAIFKDRPQEEAALRLSNKVFEFTDFLVNQLGVEDLGARFPARVTFHGGCHGLRELRIHDQPRRLLSHVRDLELVEMQDNETCCGFGGTFAAKYSVISSAMGEAKGAHAKDTGAEFIVSTDSSCLMHIQGILDRQKIPMKTIHIAEVLTHS